MNTINPASNISRPSNGGRVRLTTRGRIVIGLAGTCVALLGWMTLGSGSADASVDPAVAVAGVVVVQPGESLWSIASDIAPDSDPREMVIRIREMNGLGADHVYPGQSLAVPTT